MTFPDKLVSLALAAGMLLAHSTANPPVLSNQKNAALTPESGTPGADAALLREDPQTGGLELFVHYPAGQPGGYAFLPAKEVQTMSCGSALRCGFYVYWDGKLDNHKASEK